MCTGYILGCVVTVVCTAATQARARADAADAEFELGADLEERGSVYVVGANSAGQLGLGDVAPREHFTVVPESRGAGVCFVSAGSDIVFGVTEDHDVLVGVWCMYM